MRTSHTVRPIRRSALLTARRIPQGDDWSAVTTGLLAAGHLRALFPDFYAAHVAHLPTTPCALLGVVQAFFSLAQQKVDLQISDEITTDPLHPCAVLNLGDDLDDALACDLIAQSAGHDVHEIWPVVYGLDLDHEELFGFGVAPPLVAVLCWVLAAETAWALPFCAVDELIPAIQRQLYQCRIDPAILARLDSLPRIPPDTPMEALCDALDAQPPVHGGTLGAIIRYVCHATGNQFADLSPGVVAQMDRSNLDWRTEDLDAIGRLQREAQQIAAQYAQLNDAALRHSAVVEAIVAQVASTATTFLSGPVSA